MPMRLSTCLGWKRSLRYVRGGYFGWRLKQASAGVGGKAGIGRKRTNGIAIRPWRSFREIGQHRRGHRFGDLDAVDTGREDAARVSGAFAGGEEAAGVDAL